MKDKNFLLFFFTSCLWFFIVLVLLFILCVDKVYAQDLYFVRPRIHALTNNLNADPIVLREYDSRVVGTLQDYTYNANRVFMSYRINQNIVDDSINYIPVGTYKIKITSGQFQTINSNTTSFLTALRVFDVSDNSYISASCDVTPTFTTTSVQGNRYNWSYECDEFSVTRNDLSFLAIIIYSSNSNINYNSITANMQLIDITNEKDNQAIIDNQNQNTQDMIENNNQNTQDIIDNQNQNTQDIIDSNKSCFIVNKSYIVDENTMIYDSNGSTSYSDNYGLTGYINIKDAEINIVRSSSSTGAYTCYYNSNKDLISCITNSVFTQNPNIPLNAYFLRSSIYSPTNLPQFEICQNGNQAIIDSQNQTNQTLTGIDNFLNNDNVSINGNDVPTASFSFPISNLFTMPITLAQSYNGTCTPYNVPFRGQNITFPCINIQNYLGSNLWTIIDMLFVFGMIISIASLLRSVYIDFTTLNDTVFNSYYGNDSTYYDYANYNKKHGGAS